MPAPSSLLPQLENQVYEALRLWHAPEAKGSPLAGLRLLRAQQSAGVGLRPATNQVLRQELERLHATHPDKSTILQLRFADDLPAHVVATRQNVSEATAMSCPNGVSGCLPGTVQSRSGVFPTKSGLVASIRPTTNATRYVDILMVSANCRTFLLFSMVSEIEEVLETAVSCGSMTNVVENTALKSGSSQQGKARRASVASN